MLGGAEDKRRDGTDSNKTNGHNQRNNERAIEKHGGSQKRQNVLEKRYSDGRQGLACNNDSV